MVKDDGQRVDAGAVMASGVARGGLGLRGMQERVAQVGGTREIERTVGRGTTLFVRIPIAPAPGADG